MRIDPAVLKRVVGGINLPLLVVMGFYQGLLGSGNSVVASLLFCGGRGYDLIGALGHYCVLALAWCAVAAASCVALGCFDLGLMLPATAGFVRTVADPFRG